MKQALTLVSVVCMCCSFLKAQSPEGSSTGNQGLISSASSAKQSFIQNQEYLSLKPGSVHVYPGEDSLIGFDEKALQAFLLSKGIYGSEYQNFVALQKRAYIKNKYQLDPPLQSPPLPAPATQGKTIGNGSQINLAPCVNEDFEQTVVGQHTTANAIMGWTVESGMNGTQIVAPNFTYGAACNANAINNWNPGSPELWVMSTPILNVPTIGTIPNSPLGGTKVLKIQDANPTGLMTRLKTTFPVTTSNALFQYAYAGSWDGVHECCGQPAFRIDMYQQNCTNPTPTLMPCSNVSLTPSGPQCSSGVPGYQVTGTVSWTNWVVKVIDLTPYIGQCVTIVVTNADCSYTGHHGSAYFDARCGGQLTVLPPPQGPGTHSLNSGPVSFCAGSNQAIISGPLGYQTYSWVAPPPAVIPSSLAALPTLTVTNPMAGQIFTLYLVSQSGCQFVTTTTLVFTQVAIIGLQSGTTCAGGANGTATVVGNGSGTGYNYNWLNSANQSVGTNSVATGLAAGVYSVILTGAGSSGCGSDVATVTVTTGTPGITDISKPYCGSQAFLNMPGGSQYQWYQGTTPIANASTQSLTVNNPYNGAIYWLSAIMNGCKDSIRYTLYPSPQPVVAMKNISWVCQNGNNGTAMVSMTPAVGAAGGLNSYTVFSTGPTPSYNSILASTTSTTYPISNLAAGSYSVRAFDGSCFSGMTFSVSAYTFNFSLNASNPVLCPGNSSAIQAVVAAPALGNQFNYLWTPNLYFTGNVNTYSSTIFTPTVSPGTTNNLTLTCVVTPTAVNCPMTKTMVITAINPATPTITAIPNLCNTFASIQLTATPAGGIFSTSGSANPVTAGGLLTPAAALQGVNTLTYTTMTGPCVAKQTASYEVSIFNTAALTSSVPPLCVTSSAFNLMNIVQSANGGAWSGPGITNGTILKPDALNNSLSAGPNTLTIIYKTVSSPNTTVCPDSSPLTVVITKTMTPFIAPIPEFCTNASPFNASASPSGGTWISSYMSQQGQVFPQNAQTSVVNYTVADGPCVNTATVQLRVSKFVPAAFTASINNQCAKGGTVNLLNIVLNQGGTWSGAGVMNNAFSPAMLSTNVYTLEYATASVPNGTLCPDRNSIAVHVLNPDQPTISQAGPICSNAGAIQLTVTPPTGKWTATPYLTVDGVFTPSLATIGGNAIHYVIGTNTCNNSQMKNVVVEAFVSAKILNQLPDQCSTNAPLSLQPIVFNAGTWSGPGIIGTTFNPSSVGSGTFQLIHSTASSPSGLCPDQDVLTVRVFSIAAPAITKAGPFCTSSLPVQLQVSPIGGRFDGAAPGLVSTDGIFNPGLAKVGDNIVNYTITSGPCEAYAQATVAVEKFISADLAGQMAPICLEKGKTFPVNLNSYAQNPGGSWTGGGVTGTMFDPFAAHVGSNNILIYATHSMPTASLCADSSALRVEIRNLPQVKVVSDKEDACAPATIVFNTPAVTKGKGLWHFDDGTGSEGLTVTHTFDQPGTYYATFSYRDEAGCEATPVKARAIVVHELPTANFTLPDEILISSPDVQLTNESQVLANNRYTWKLNGVDVSSQVHPVFNFPAIGQYKVTLSATSSLGCADEISKMVSVKNDFNVFIPGSFTPNYDGLNDVFAPVFTDFGLDEGSYELEIFDRWGHSVFYSTDRQKAWDGTKSRGEPVKQDVYVYKLKYKDMEGNMYNKIGDVTVLR